MEENKYMETIISNDVTETRGLDMEDVEQIAASEEITTKTERIISADIQVLQTYKKDIEEANFIELGNIKRKLEREKEDLAQSKEMADSIIELKEQLKKLKTDDMHILATQMDIANLENDSMFNDLNKFLEEYDMLQEETAKLLQRTNERLDEFKAIPKTTSFMTGLMLETLNKNLKRVEETAELNPNGTVKIQKMIENQMQIFIHRDSMEFILSKVGNYDIQLRRVINDCLKPNADRDIIPSIQKSVTETFIKVFNTNQLSAFEKYLTDLYGDSTDSFFVQYVLYLIYCRELDHGRAYGNHKWVEVLIMNVLDISTDLYDLESGYRKYDVELIRLRDAICKHIENYKKKRKK